MGRSSTADCEFVCLFAELDRSPCHTRCHYSTVNRQCPPRYLRTCAEFYGMSLCMSLSTNNLHLLYPSKVIKLSIPI